MPRPLDSEDAGEEEEDIFQKLLLDGGDMDDRLSERVAAKICKAAGPSLLNLSSYCSLCAWSLNENTTPS